MSIRVALNHVTHYRYDRLVTLLPHIVRLRPAPHCRTPILSYSLRIQPGDHFLNWQQDPYSNYLARLVFHKPAREFRVEVDLVAEMTAINPFDFFVEPAAEHYPLTYDPVLTRELGPYLETAPAGPKMIELAAQARRSRMPINDFIVATNRLVQERIRYLIRLEPGVQSCEETLEKGSGSCRDSAWLLVQLFRRLGVAARFVSGYLIQLSSDEKPLDGPAGPEKDFTDLHAWTEIYLPGAGWIGLDATSGLLAGEGHIPLACAAEPITAAAITGSFNWDKDPSRNGDDETCGEEFSFDMSVKRIRETPRVTKPYTPEQWQVIDKLGRHIDEELRELDVRLTMGGEPTFVSMDARDEAEWTTAALGDDKRQKAGALLLRLRDRFAPGALLHFGQGKWYPGESLPRWALGCYWRRDGVPFWDNPALIAEESRDYGYGPQDAQRFAVALAEELGIAPAHIPGYEDIWHYLWRERRLPVNVDPLKSRLENAEERATLAKIFEQGLDKVVGYALPLRRRHDGAQPSWETGRWSFRGEHMFLIPGDSPMGYRLPLDSLLWEPSEKMDRLIELDTFADRPPLPTRVACGQRTLPVDGHAAPARNQQTPSPLPSMPTWSDADDDTALIRTALCIEPRHGRMYVFMPPQRYLEDYLELVAAVEAAAARLHMPVLIEGYAPPFDPRLSHFQLTPDPGVLEVNIHPAHSWDELVKNTNIIYEEARQTRLCTEKFMLDGRHTGTGGGNHVIIGGPTPADSPVLRRPDLLRSLIAFWHNHPSLSYLFSGLFVGPTSQAPRIDEARNDSIYELELAFQCSPHAPREEGRSPQEPSSLFPDKLPTHAPWLVDRIFRNLLTDVTGNTHRAEFCIDKLFPPDSSSGRRGLVELRAFEMPPHAQMSLAQQVLLRALIARFWKDPYQRKLVRWGTELHDRFMLPYFIDQDFRDVIEELRQAGFPLQAAWFAPHLEFRLPFIGSVTHHAVRLDLRQAIEPWHVLGEEATAGGTARYVDSSLERIQVKVNGLTDTRHVVTCNGRRLPLHPTGVNGEFVAGIRYRAWQPPNCLHPTIGVHTPLILDVVDTWMEKSLGGCTYYVAHPGGRSYEVFPVNAREAEARRIARFFPFGHSPGPMDVPAEPTPAECPLTLDLRQPASSPPARKVEERERGYVWVRNALDLEHVVR